MFLYWVWNFVAGFTKIVDSISQATDSEGCIKHQETKKAKHRSHIGVQKPNVTHIGQRKMTWYVYVVYSKQHWGPSKVCILLHLCAWLVPSAVCRFTSQTYKMKNNFFLDNKERIINLRAERHTYTLVYRCILCIWANTSCKNLSFSINCIFSLHVNFSFRKFVYHLLCHYLLKKYCWLWRMQFFFLIWVSY